MKYFFDTEFIEHHSGIDLVSIGIVSENRNTFYAESLNYDERKADQWVKDNVLSKLKFRGVASLGLGDYHRSENQINFFGTDTMIADNILMWIRSELKDKEPQFFAYFANYDWVVFARLFGRLIDKPKEFPMWVVDLKQMMWERGLTKEWKQKVCPDPEGEHNALVDAQWNKKLYDEIIKYPLK